MSNNNEEKKGKDTNISEEKKQEENEEFDPTKEAFFSDLAENEEEIAAEAYEHVEHGLSLLNDGFYDDAIEAMRLAMSLYTQISRDQEIKMLKDKISDIYLMKEKAFSEEQFEPKGQIKTTDEPREKEIIEQEEEKESKDLSTQPEEEIQIAKSEEQKEEREKVEYSREDKEIILNEAFEFVERGTKLAKDTYYEEGIENLKKAKELFEKLEKTDMISDTEAKIKNFKAEKKQKEEEKQEKAKLEDQKKKKAQEVLRKREEQVKQEKIKEEEKRYKKLQAYETKKLEEKEFRRTIEELVDKAEKLTREYELQIRKGNFEQKCVYPEVVHIYTEVRKKLFERGWKKEAQMYTGQIKKYNEKLEKDKKLRKLEAQKKEKEKEFKDYYKSTAKVPETKQSKVQSKRQINDKLFEEEISKQVDQAEKLVRDYELQIRKGNFEQKSVYPEVIDIYTEVRKKLFKRGWEKEARMYTNQIKRYKEKLEKDKKLRKLEEEKKQKDKEYEAYFKMGKVQKQAKSLKKERKEETLGTEKADKAFELIDEAEKIIKNYELKLKKNILLYDSPYEETINLYKKAKEILKKADWNSEASKLNNTIRYYEKKKVKDEKLRKIEAENLEEKSKVSPIDQEKEKLQEDLESGKLEKTVKEAKKKEDEIHQRILDKINNAEQMAKKYEKKIKRNKVILYLECPYENIIEIYRDAKREFKKLGWDDEAQKLNNSINYYKKQLQKDKKLREFEKKKQEKEKQFEESLKVTKKPESIQEELKREKLAKAEEHKKEKVDEIFDKINRAEQKGTRYEHKRKGGGILELKSPYSEIIEIYREARKELKGIGWDEEANKLISSINYYKKKLQQDEKLREVEGKKKEKAAEFEKLTKTRPKSSGLEQKKAELLEKQKRSSDLEAKREKAFHLMDKAKIEFKKNKFEKAISLYKESEELFDEINWEDGKRMVKQSISIIKRKKANLAQRQKKIEQKAKKKEDLEKKLEERILRLQSRKKNDQKEKREQLMQDQKKKQEEMELSDKAYGFLEEGTQLANKKKFDKALEKYEQARDIFRDLGWKQEVSRINNDLLYALKKEARKAEKLDKVKKKQQQKEKQLKKLLDQAQKDRKETAKKQKEEKRQRLRELTGAEKEKEKIKRKLTESKNLAEQGKVNEAVLLIKKAQKISIKADLQDKFPELEQNITQVIQNAQIPIITKRMDKKDFQSEEFQSAYHALDKAEIAFKAGHFMKAVSELNEAKFNLKSLSSKTSFISQIKEKIEFAKEQIKAGRKSKRSSSSPEVTIENIEEEEPSSELAYDYMDKSNKEKRKNNFEKAIQFANKAKDIFTTLGSEWAREKGMVSKHIKQLKQSYKKRQQLFKAAREEREQEAKVEEQEKEDLQTRIEERRIERRKRILKLMKEKKEKEKKSD